VPPGKGLIRNIKKGVGRERPTKWTLQARSDEQKEVMDGKPEAYVFRFWNGSRHHKGKLTNIPGLVGEKGGNLEAKEKEV